MKVMVVSDICFVYIEVINLYISVNEFIYLVFRIGLGFIVEVGIILFEFVVFDEVLLIVFFVVGIVNFG